MRLSLSHGDIEGERETHMIHTYSATIGKFATAAFEIHISNVCFLTMSLDCIRITGHTQAWVGVISWDTFITRGVRKKVFFFNKRNQRNLRVLYIRNIITSIFQSL